MHGQESSIQEGQVGGETVQSPRPRKRPKAGFIVGAVLLLIALFGGSLFLILHYTGEGFSSSPTNGKISTLTDTPTPTATPDQALFSDNFTNNNAGWDTSSDSGYTRDVSNNVLTLADTKHGTILTESLPTNNIFDNYIVTVIFTLVKADWNDSAGVYVRGDSNLDHDYRIEINGNNTYDIVKEYLDANATPQAAILLGPAKAASLHPLGQPNVLRVILHGPRITMVINNVVVGSVTDNDYTKGQIDLFVHNGTTSSGVKAVFERVEVDHLQERIN